MVGRGGIRPAGAVQEVRQAPRGNVTRECRAFRKRARRGHRPARAPADRWPPRTRRPPASGRSASASAASSASSAAAAGASGQRGIGDRVRHAARRDRTLAGGEVRRLLLDGDLVVLVLAGGLDDLLVRRPLRNRRAVVLLLDVVRGRGCGGRGSRGGRGAAGLEARDRGRRRADHGAVMRHVLQRVTADRGAPGRRDLAQRAGIEAAGGRQRRVERGGGAALELPRAGA